MTESLSERMAQFEAAVREAAEAARERDRVANDVGTRLADHVETAVAETGTTVEAVDHAAEGKRFRLEARLDRAAMVAALTDELPDGFAVSNLNDDGSLSIEYTGSGRTPTKRNHDAVLKAIVAEETVTDDDGFITAVPGRDRVLERATDLGVPDDAAADRLERLRTLDMVDIDDGQVYPGENFSRI